MNDYNQEYFYVSNDREDIYPTLHYVGGGGNYTEIDMLELEDTTSKRILGFDSAAVFPELADFHELKRWAPVVSRRLKEMLESLNLKETQFLPVLIRDDKNNLHDGYSILHVYNEIKCMDWDESDWEKNRFNKEKASVDRLVLDNAKLDEVPLEERLIFKVWEDSSHLLFHRSVVEKMLELIPTGLTISSWHVEVEDLTFFKEYENKKEKKDDSPTKEFESHLMTFHSYGPHLDMFLELGPEAVEIGRSMGIDVNFEEDKAKLQKTLQEARNKNWLDKLCLAVLEESHSKSAKMVCCLEMLKAVIHPGEARNTLVEIVESEESGYAFKAEKLLQEWDEGNRNIEF